jgi:thiamine biosynthesis lipoprotein ApbE
MKPKFLLLGGAVLALGLGVASINVGHPRLWASHYENVLGTSLDLKVGAVSEADATRAEEAVLREIDREAGILSAWDASSEFSRWTQTHGEALLVSRELFEVLGLFDQWRERTEGALDASAEAVTRVWKQAEKRGTLPSQSELNSAVTAVRQKHWQLDAVHRTATHLSDTPLALNSFAKSYIAGHAADAALRGPGVRSVVVNIGGDMVVRGAGREWVDVADPKSDAENAAPIVSIDVRNRTIATSGNYRRGEEIGGRHYSHIVDPRTGLPCDEILSSTVIASNPADAGAMATAFSVLTPQESRRVAASVPGAEYLLITKFGQRIMSPGFAALVAAAGPVPSPAPAPSPDAAWDDMQLTVTYDLAKQDPRARRPYFAAWVEDSNKVPVRTLALWYNRDRWLSELRAWYRSDRVRAAAEGKDLAHSIASATRPSGHYTLQWDGKDNQGKPVKAGKYTIYLEGAREHGGYDLLHHEIDFNGTPTKVEIPGGHEIASASLDYHRIAR